MHCNKLIKKIALKIVELLPIAIDSTYDFSETFQNAIKKKKGCCLLYFAQLLLCSCFCVNTIGKLALKLPIVKPRLFLFMRIYLVESVVPDPIPHAVNLASLNRLIIER